MPHLFSRRRQAAPAYAQRIAETNARNAAVILANQEREREYHRLRAEEQRVLDQLAELTDEHGALEAARVMFGGAR